MPSTNSGPAQTLTPNIVAPQVAAGSTSVAYDPSNVAIGGGTIGKIPVSAVGYDAQPWVYATFSGNYSSFSYRDSRELRLLFSNDGKSFSPLNQISSYYTPPNNASVRDPSIVQWGSGFLLAYTRADALVADPLTSLVDVCYSTDLVNWTLIAQPDFTDSGVANISYVWAPELMVDDDGNIYVYASVRTGVTQGTANDGGLWVKKATNKDPTATWGASTQITGITGLDPQVSKHNGRYYYAYANIVAPGSCYIQINSGTSPLSFPTVVYTGAASALQTAFNNILGGDFEGPSVTWLTDSGKVRVYADNRKQPGTYYTEATYTDNADGSVTFSAWSTPVLVGTAVRATGRHGTVVRLSGVASGLATSAAAAAANKKAAIALSAAMRVSGGQRAYGRGLTFNGNGAADMVAASGVGAGTDIGTADFSVHWLLQRTPTRIGASALPNGLGFLSNSVAGGDRSNGVRFWYVDDKLVASWINGTNTGERSWVTDGLSSYAYSGEFGLLSFERQNGVVCWRWNGQKLQGYYTTSGTTPPSDFTQSVQSSAVGFGNYNGIRAYLGKIAQFFILNFVPDDDLYMLLLSQGVTSEISQGLLTSTAIGSFVPGARYKVTAVGTSAWSAIGGGNPAVGSVFQPETAGTASGGGTALRLGCLVNYNLRDGTGTTAADSSGNAITATITGAPTWAPTNQ